jgi:hypothetical protein
MTFILSFGKFFVTFIYRVRLIQQQTTIRLTLFKLLIFKEAGINTSAPAMPVGKNMKNRGISCLVN